MKLFDKSTTVFRTELLNPDENVLYIEPFTRISTI